MKLMLMLSESLYVGNATRVPKNPGNPPVFKPVNPGLCAVKKPGFTGLIYPIMRPKIMKKLR